MEIETIRDIILEWLSKVISPVCVVDMRWGIPAEASDVHSASDLCLEEIRHCQQLSIGPNFLILAGQRYGFCPLPATILRSEMDVILSDLLEEGPDADLLSTSYWRDHNVTPNVYVLQPKSYITSKLSRSWEEIENKLRKLLVKGAELAIEKGDLKRDALNKYSHSVTEQEICEGLIYVRREHDRNNNCLLFSRVITDLNENLDEPTAKRYVDMDPNGNGTDASAIIALHRLRDAEQKKLAVENIIRSPMTWSSLFDDEEVCSEYLTRVCNNFVNKTKMLLDRNIKYLTHRSRDALYQEVLQHSAFAFERSKSFVGRQELMKDIMSYIHSESDQPFVIQGESGTGKTTIISEISNIVTRSEKQLGKPSTVVRFIGITPESSTIQQVLYSICHQLAYITGRSRQRVPEDYKNLKLYFTNFVQKGQFSGVVLLLLDSLDQLSTNHQGHKLDWLPSRIAPNMKIIVSTVPETLGILDRLENKINFTNIIHVPPMPLDTCEEAMTHYLKMADKSVTYTQWQFITAAFQHCALPLFLKLTFEEVARWHSYDEITASSLAPSVEACIEVLFERIENKHGKTLVQRALGYITAARDGLSEGELEDILSIDDVSLNSVFTFYEPPIRRLPPCLWSRIRKDIEAYLVLHEADGMEAFHWYHKQFAEAAAKRYLQNDNVKIDLHRHIADFYDGTWSGSTMKPFEYTDSLASRLKRESTHGAACRYVPEQPLTLQCNKASERFNNRKLNQLPFSLAMSQQYDRLKSDIFCNYTWIHTKLRATSIQQVLADYNVYEDKETSLVADALRMSSSSIRLDSNVLGPELSGRLLSHTEKYAHIRELVRQCDRMAEFHCPLVPMTQIYTAPGGPLQYECEVDVNIKCSVDVDVFESPDGILLTVKPLSSKTVRVWELTLMEPRPDMMMPFGEIHPSQDGRFLNIFRNNRFLDIYKSDCGELHGQIEYGFGAVNCLSVRKKMAAFTLQTGTGPSVVDLQTAEMIHTFRYHSRVVAINPSETYVVFNSGHTLMLFKLPLMERQSVIKISDEPRQIIFIGQSLKLFVLTETKKVQSVSYDESSRKHKTNNVISDIEIREMVISNKEEALLIRASMCLYVFDAKSEVLRYRLQKMPHGVFVETMSVFSGAGFTPKDDMIIASRYTYLAVWDAASGTPLRLLQASISPIEKLYTCTAINKTVTRLENNTIQVWNIDNIDADIEHFKEVIKGPVVSMALSPDSRQILCHGEKSEAHILDVQTYDVIKSFVHSKDSARTLVGVQYSPNAAYVVTRAFVNKHGRSMSEQSKLFTEDKIWNVSTGKKLCHTLNNRYVVFNKPCDLMVLITCVSRDEVEWICNSYSLVVRNLKSKEEQFIQMPECAEFVSEPFIISKNDINSLITIIQICNKVKDYITNEEGTSSYRNVLYIRNLAATWKDHKTMTLRDIWKEADDNDQLMAARENNDGTLLLIYGKHNGHFEYSKDQGILLPKGMKKEVVIYNIFKGYCLKSIAGFLRPDSDLRLTRFSSHSSLILDSELRLFDNITKTFVHQINTKIFKPSCRLALDGRYIIALSENMSDVLVIRSCDGVQVGRLFVHGKARCLEVGQDDRTVGIGCCDGRIMSLSLVLEFKDPINEHVKFFKSRGNTFQKQDSLLPTDVRRLSLNNWELARLSARTRVQIIEDSKKRPTFHTLSRAVALTSQFNSQRSQACSIQ